MDTLFGSDVPISEPVLFTDMEVASFDGFAFTQTHGVVVEYRPVPVDWREYLGG